MYLAALLILIGCTVSVLALKTLRSPLPQYMTTGGTTSYQRVAVVFLIAGIIMLVVGIATAAVIDARLFSSSEDPAANSCSNING